MRRGTTPTFNITVKRDLSGWRVYVIISGGSCPLTISDDRFTEKTAEGGKTTIKFTLTQKETLSFPPGTAEVEVRAVKHGTALASRIKKIDVERVLIGGEIYE